MFAVLHIPLQKGKGQLEESKGEKRSGGKERVRESEVELLWATLAVWQLEKAARCKGFGHCTFVFAPVIQRV